MAAPTYAVPMYTVNPNDEIVEYLLPATVATYYPGEMIGMDVNGYAVKFADAASVKFLGINAESVRIDVVSDDAAGDKRIKVQLPSQGYAMYIQSAAITDVGKKVYAAYSNEVQFTTGTYGNFAGTVKAYLNATTVLIDPPPAGAGRTYPDGVSRVMAAAGAQVLYKWDLNKTIIVPNTAALTIDLPAMATTQAGDKLTFVKTSADAEIITINTPGSETIDGSATHTALDAAYDTVCIVSNGSNWTILFRDIA